MTTLLKSSIRESIKNTRSKVSEAYQKIASHQVCSRIIGLDCYRHAKYVAVYQAVHGEIDLTELWHIATKENKTCYFPVLNDDLTLSFLPAAPNTPFKKNKFDIPEPFINKKLEVPVEQLDLIVLPVVAFDVKCTRLGMGSGYYDRTLKNKSNPVLIGAAYQFQRTNTIEAEPWDVPLDAMVTQRAIYWRYR